MGCCHTTRAASSKALFERWKRCRQRAQRGAKVVGVGRGWGGGGHHTAPHPTATAGRGAEGASCRGVPTRAVVRGDARACVVWGEEGDRPGPAQVAMGWFSSGRSRRAPPPRSGGLSSGGDGGAPPPPAAVGGAPAAFPGDAGAPPRALTDEERAELAGRWIREQLLRRREEFWTRCPCVWLRARGTSTAGAARGSRAHRTGAVARAAAAAPTLSWRASEVVPLTATNVALASNTSTATCGMSDWTPC